MKEANYSSRSAHTVRDERQAKLLSEQSSFRYFAPFLAKTCTVSLAAKELGCNLDTMFYRVKTFLDAGLLGVVQVEKRAGRSIKHYRSAHDAYYIPSNITSFTNFEEEMRQALRTYKDAIVKELARTARTLNRRGRRIFRDESGEVGSHTASDEAHTINYDLLPQLLHSDEFAGCTLAELFTDTLMLTDDEAKTLLSRLYQLRLDNKFEAVPSREPYLLRVVMVPLKPTRLHKA